MPQSDKSGEAYEAADFIMALIAQGHERASVTAHEKVMAHYILSLRTPASAEREPKKRIEGCQHPMQRMVEWIDEGACPICAVATAGELRERLAETQKLTCEDIIGCSQGQPCLRKALAPSSERSQVPVAWRYKVHVTQQDWFYSWDQPTHIDERLVQPLYLAASATRRSIVEQIIRELDEEGRASVVVAWGKQDGEPTIRLWLEQWLRRAEGRGA